MTLLKKSINIVKDVWVILGITIFLLLAMETGLSLYFYLKKSWVPPGQIEDYRVKADTYPKVSWVDAYFRENAQSNNLKWESYLYWRRLPYRGDYVNVDPEGIRRSYKDSVREKANPAAKVFFFGGSTIWGVGARDDFTIPSIFVKEAKIRGVNCEAVNFGEVAYVSTQEVLQLMIQLQKGNIPDTVIFYDGFNDTFSAFQQRVAGLPHNEFNREIEFNLLHWRKREKLRTLAVQDAIKQLTIVQSFLSLSRKLGLKSQRVPFRPLEYKNPVLDKGVLIRELAERYIGNIKLAQALSKYYGFKCLFYWQPMLFQKQHLTEYEREASDVRNVEIDAPNYAGMREFYLETYAYMKEYTAGLKDDFIFHDISSIFREAREPLYIDVVHLGENGNGLIARRMVEDFIRLMNKSGKADEKR